MTNEEAKFILQGYRPDGQDSDNPALAKALAKASSDPALRVWFERERAFDASVAEALRKVTPPAGLRESILAGTRLSRPEERRPRLVPSMTWWFAAAAAAILLLVGTWWGASVPARPGFDALLQVAWSDYSGSHPEAKHADEMGRFGRWLERGGVRLAAAVMPVEIDELRRQGCRRFNLAGVEVFELCFQRDGGWYHIYLAPAAGFSVGPTSRDPMFHEQGEFVAATWADEKFVYLLSSTTGMEALRSLL